MIIKKLSRVLGVGLILCGLLFSIIHFSFITISPDENLFRDIFGLPIPVPPEWITYIPFVGYFLGVIFESFSLHGLVGLTIIGLLLAFGFKLIDIADNKHPRKTHKEKLKSRSRNNIQPKQLVTRKVDFGLSIKEIINDSNSTINITEPFTIINLVLYSNRISSITAQIDNKLATFDFNDDVLKVFIWTLADLNLITRPELEKLLRNQIDQPVVITFNKEQAHVTGMILTCKLGQKDKSETTGEVFIPLIIVDAKIVQQPAAIRI